MNFALEAWNKAGKFPHFLGFVMLLRVNFPLTLLFLQCLAVLVYSSVIYVAPDGSTSTSCGSESKPCSLSTGIQIASNGSTIILENGIYNTQSTIYINSTNLIIQGSGAAEFNNSAIFNIQDSSITLIGCTFLNYTSRVVITAIYSTLEIDSTLFEGGTTALIANFTSISLSDCTFTRLVHIISSSPYALMTSGNAISINNCTFYMNELPISISSNATTITNCQFTKIGSSICLLVGNNARVINSTFSDSRGYVSLLIEGEAPFIQSSVFSNNWMQVSGIYHAGNNLGAINCTFNNNRAHLTAAIYTRNYAYIDQSLFENNVVIFYNQNTNGPILLDGSDGRVLHSVFRNNSVSVEFKQNSTGAITGIGGNHTIAHCLFENNTVVSNYKSFGAAIALFKGGEILNCIFINNTASTEFLGYWFSPVGCYGSTVYLGGETQVLHSSFYNTTSFCEGSAIYTTQPLTVENCTFENLQGAQADVIYSLVNVSIHDSQFTNNGVSSSGPVIYAQDFALEIDNCHFSHYSVKAPLILSTCNSTSIYYSVFESNQYSQSAYVEFFGLIHLSANSVTVSHSVFSDNQIYAASSGAGVLFTDANEVDIQSSDFMNNQCTITPQFSSNYGGGGALHLRNSTANVSNCAFEGNSVIGNDTRYSAHAFGGAIYLNSTDAVVQHCTGFNNTVLSFSNSNGGFLYMYEGSLHLFSSDFTFNEVIASKLSQFSGSNGGCVAGENATVFVESCSFISNNAVASSFGRGHGGAVSLSNSTLQVDNTQFLSNSASKCGGAIFGDILNCEIVDCLFSRNIVTNTTSDSLGGALATAGSVVAINQTFFSSNYVYGNNIAFGGAVADVSATLLNGIESSPSTPPQNGTTTINNSVFEDNQVIVTYTSSKGFGGAVSSTLVYSTNSTFRNNTAMEGGAIFMYDGSISRSNFTNNKATQNGGDIYTDTVVVQSSIFDFSYAQYGSSIYGISVNVSDSTLVNQNYQPFHGIVTSPIFSGTIFIRNCTTGSYNYGTLLLFFLFPTDFCLSKLIYIFSIQMFALRLFAVI